MAATGALLHRGLHFTTPIARRECSCAQTLRGGGGDMAVEDSDKRLPLAPWLRLTCKYPKIGCVEALVTCKCSVHRRRRLSSGRPRGAAASSGGAAGPIHVRAVLGVPRLAFPGQHRGGCAPHRPAGALATSALSGCAIRTGLVIMRPEISDLLQFLEL